MSEYAVTNPATGERVEEYPTISDAALADAIATADRAHREWSRATTTEERAALVRRVGELHVERREELAEIIVREMGKPVEQALGEVDFCASIYEYYATEADEPSRRRADRAVGRRRIGVRPPELRRRPARDHALELPVLPGGAVRRTEPRRRQHDPAEACAPVPGIGGGDPADLRRRGLPCRRVHEHLRHERPGRGPHRRPPGPGRVGHRLGARGRGGGRDRGAEPQEGRPRARRLGSVHPAEHRRPRQRRRIRRGGAARERRPGMQRRQALRRRGRPLRPVRGQADGGADRGRAVGSLVAGCGDGPALVGDGGRPPRRPAAAGRGGRRDARRRRRAAGTSSRPAC